MKGHREEDKRQHVPLRERVLVRKKREEPPQPAEQPTQQQEEKKSMTPTTSESSSSSQPAAIPVDPAIKPPWPAPPATPPTEPPPDTHLKPPEHVPAGQFAVKLKKSFMHFGLPYVVNDYYVGFHADIAALIRQGYCDPPKTQGGAMTPTT